MDQLKRSPCYLQRADTTWGDLTWSPGRPWQENGQGRTLCIHLFVEHLYGTCGRVNRWQTTCVLSAAVMFPLTTPRTHTRAQATKSRPLRDGLNTSWGPVSDRIGETGFEPAASCSQSKRATKLRHSPIATTCGGFIQIIGTDGVLAIATGFERLTGLSQQPSDAVIGLPVVSRLSPVIRFCLHFLERLETKSSRCPPATLNLGCLL